MKRKLLLWAMLVALPAGQGPIRAADEEPSPSAVSTTPSDIYPQVTCTTSNTVVCADVLQMAADIRDQLGPLLKLGPAWRFPVHIRVVTPDDPPAGKVRQEGVSVLAVDKTMEITAVLPSSDLDAREFIQRQFITALLWEKFFAANQSFDAHTRLDVVPLWLIEGLREWLNEDSGHDRESIVKRAVNAHRAPSLTEVIAWRQLGDNRLMGLWQRAFCYYLVNSFLRKGPQRDDFQQWLAAVAGSDSVSAKLHFPTETAWQHELVDATQRSRDIVYTWDETTAQLAATEIVAIPPDKDKETAETRICTLDTVSTFPRNDKLLAVLQQKVFELTNLELRAQVSWRPIVALYRFGLTALIQAKKPDQGQKLIDEARQQRAAEMAYHQKLLDYVNWFEVTKDHAGETTRFRTYFSTAQEMERVEADPAHPNPIRANLLQVESQL